MDLPQAAFVLPADILGLSMLKIVHMYQTSSMPDRIGQKGMLGTSLPRLQASHYGNGYCRNNNYLI